jgi:hypothetical protein
MRSLYSNAAMSRRITRFHAEALAADLPMGQRGISAIVDAALWAFETLTPEERSLALRQVLPPEGTPRR